ncbi:MAG: alkaline phosphatase family protein [Solirubrobacterales bacterium]
MKHVFVIMLSNQPFVSVFGPSSSAPYLSQSLERKGELLVRYYAVAHEELANGIAFLSGQGPTVATAANCPTYADIAATGVGADRQVAGQGCVYPPSTETLAGQLSAKHLTWRSYVEGIDEGTAGGGPCAHPILGAADPTAGPQPSPPTTAQPYVTFRDPFVYFHSVIDSRACAADVVGLNALSSDLSKGARSPSLSYIVPDRCHDANPTPCAPAAPAGPPAADGFLKLLVPKILSSKAYRDGGLLVITADEAPSAGEFADSSSCCAQPQFPNLPAPAGSTAGLAASGGGQVGALLLSPFVNGGTTSQEPYNHFSLLRTIEDLFGLKHLGYAGRSRVSSFEPSIFSAHSSG